MTADSSTRPYPCGPRAAVAAFALAAAVMAGRADAVPLELTFEGIIPLLTTTTHTEISLSGAITVSDHFATANGAIDVGGGVGTLEFDRSLTEGASPIDVTSGFQSLTRLGYDEGSEASFPIGDYLYLILGNSFARYEPGLAPTFDGIAPGDVFFRSVFSQITLSFFTGFSPADQTFPDLFGPGPPSALSWADPTPSNCSFSPCDDGFGSLGSFTHSSFVAIADEADAASFTTTTTRHFGDNLVLTRATLGHGARRST